MSDDKLEPSPPDKQDGFLWKKEFKEPPPEPNYLARFFAIVLLLVMAPVLLLTGYCGLLSAATLMAPLGIGIFAAVAYVTYKGVRTLWSLHDAPEGTGWIFVLVLIALVMGTIVLWASNAFRGIRL
jgi:hypothetical protein